MPTESQPSSDDSLAQLIRQAERAANQDAAAVGLGLETRVMSRIQSLDLASNLDRWATGFFRAAFGSAAVVLLLSAWVWVGSVVPTLESEYALSALDNDPVTWSLPFSW